MSRDWRVTGVKLDISTEEHAAKIALQEAIRLERDIAFWNVYSDCTRKMTPEGKIVDVEHM